LYHVAIGGEFPVNHEYAGRQSFQPECRTTVKVHVWVFCHGVVTNVSHECFDYISSGYSPPDDDDVGDAIVYLGRRTKEQIGGEMRGVDHVQADDLRLHGQPIGWRRAVDRRKRRMTEQRGGGGASEQVGGGETETRVSVDVVSHGRLVVFGSTRRRMGVIGDGSAIRRRVDPSPAPSHRIFAFGPVFFAFQSLQQFLSQFTAGFSPIFCGRACVPIVIFVVLVYTVTLAAVIDELEGKPNFVGLETDNSEESRDDAAQGSATAATAAQVVAAAVRVSDQSESDAEKGDGMKNPVIFQRVSLSQRQRPDVREAH